MNDCRTGATLLAAALLLTCGAEAQKAVLVVRHGENAGDKLTAEGLSRAGRLAEVLHDAGITAIYSTDTKRTKGTATPLSEELKLPIRIYDPGGGDVPIDSTAFVHQLARDNPHDVVLVVGHTTTIPDLLKVLGCPGDIEIAPKEFGDLFVVVPKGGGPPTLLRLKY